MNQSARRLLRDLKERGAEGVPRSRLSRACDSLVQELRTCHAVQWRPSGHGQVLSVMHPEALDAVVKRYFPLGLDDPLDEIVDRATAVLVGGDAKLARSGASEGVFLRSNRDATIVSTVDGVHQVPVAELTRVAGGAAILLDDSRDWTFTGTVAVIENAEAFWRHDRVLDVDLAVYSAGRMSSRRLLDWLASVPMEECTFVHWGDYDPIGAAEFLRLQHACPDRARMHLPPNLETLLASHGNRALLVKQRNVLDQIRNHAENSTIAKLIDLWDRHQRVLEQELLLLTD